MTIMPAFQAGDVGLIPTTRSMKVYSLNIPGLPGLGLFREPWFDKIGLGLSPRSSVG